MSKIDLRIEDTKNTVKYEPVLNSICFKGLTPLELNIFFSMIYRLKDNETNEVVLTFDEIKTLSQYDKSRRDSARFKNHLNNVYNKILKIDFRIDNDEVEGYGNLFSHFLVSKTEPIITMKVNKEFAYIFNELSIYTSFDLLEYTNLKSTYSKKIFTLIKQFEKTGWVEIKYQEFRELLDIPNSYYPKDIERRVLIPVENELNQYFKTFKYVKKLFGNKINAIKFTWDITKPTPELYEPPVNPKTELKKDYNKFKKELPVVNRATEKTAIEYQKKQEENQKKSQEIEKEINEKYSNYLELSEEIKRKIEEKIYNKFLENSNAIDNKTMRGIFEKSKKSWIVEDYEEILEELEKENILEEQELIQVDEKIPEEPKQTLEKIEEENPIGWEQKTFIIEPKTEVELEAEKIIKTIFPFLDEELLDEDINYIRSTLRRKKMYKELEIFDLFIENKQTTVVDSKNIYKDEKCLGLSEFGKNYIENYIKENQLEHLLISEKTKKELKGSARENRLIKLYKNNFKIN